MIFGTGTDRALNRAFGIIKSMIANGQSVRIVLIGDSTIHGIGSGLWRFANDLGPRIPGQTHDVTFSLWAEWVVNQATGPKVYAAKTKLFSGSSGAAIDIYSATLPGTRYGDFLDASRYANAVQAINPHLVMWYQGHNLVNAYGTEEEMRGAVLGPISRVISDYPSAQHLIISQNPRRDDNSYDPVWKAELLAYKAHPNVSFLDVKAKWPASKPANLYRDNQHPSDPDGNTLVGSLISAAYDAAELTSSNTILNWLNMTGDQVLLNGDFSDFSGATPTSWSAAGTIVASKDMVNVMGGAAYSVALTASDGNSYLQQFFNSTQNKRLASKKVNLFAACYIPPDLTVQQMPQITFVTYPSSGPASTYGSGNLGRFAGGWCLQGILGVQMPDGVGAGGNYIRINPAFAITNPVQTPCNIQKIILTTDDFPRGLFYT